MHRSGTSATTGALRLAGVSLGENLLGPGEDNPKGYWENTQAVAINEELLAALDRTWDDIRPLPEGWESTTAAAQAAARIHALVDSEFAGAKVWAIKDPRLCRLVPVWRRVLAERGIRTTALLVARHPEEVAASISRRNNWSAEVGKLLWMRYVFESERYTRDLPRAVITYENLLADPAGALEHAAQRLGIELPPREQGREREFGEFIDSADRHHRHGAGAPSSKLDAALAEAYAALAGIESGGGEWAAFLGAAEAVRAFLEPYAAGLDGLAAMSHYWQSRFAEADVERATTRSDFLAQVRWSEEAVERERGLHEALETERSRAGAIRDQLAAQQQELLSRLDAFFAQNETLREQQRQEQRRADAAEVEVGRLRADLAAQREAAQRMEAQQQELLSRLDAFFAQNETLREQQRQEQRRADAAEVEVGRLRADLAAQREAAQRMEAQQQELLSRLDAFFAQNETLREQQRQEQRRADAAEVEVGRLRADLAAQREAAQGMADEIATLREESLELSRLNQEKELRILAMERSLSWRLSRPARSALDWLRRIFGN